MMTLIQAKNMQGIQSRSVFGTRLRAAFDRRAAMSRKVRNLKQLQSLSDCQLDDIGVSRQMLNDV